MCQDPSTISARTQAERRRRRHRPRLLRTCAPHCTWGRRASWWMRAGNCRPHCTWGRRASWWMRREDVPGPKHNIGQDPSRTTTQTTPTATTTKDLWPSLHLGPSSRWSGNRRPHCTWGRRASWWMRREDVPGPKHNIGQDPSRTTTQTTPTATTTKDLCLTTTMTSTDDRRLLRTAIATAARSCRMASSSVSRAIVFSSRPLSLSLSLSLSALGPPGLTQSLRLLGPFRWSGPVPGPKHNIGQDPSRTTTQTTPTATITKDPSLTTTMTSTDDRRLLRTVVATACRIVQETPGSRRRFPNTLQLVQPALQIAVRQARTLLRNPISPRKRGVCVYTLILS